MVQLLRLCCPFSREYRTAVKGWDCKKTKMVVKEIYKDQSLPISLRVPRK